MGIFLQGTQGPGRLNDQSSLPRFPPAPFSLSRRSLSLSLFLSGCDWTVWHAATTDPMTRTEVCAHAQQFGAQQCIRSSQGLAHTCRRYHCNMHRHACKMAHTHVHTKCAGVHGGPLLEENRGIWVGFSHEPRPPMSTVCLLV